MSNTTPVDPADSTNPSGETQPINPTVATEPVNPTGATEPINPTGATEPIPPSDANAATDDTSRWFSPDAAASPSAASRATAPLRAAEPQRLPARFGTIFWGVLLLTFAGFMIVNSVVPVVQDPVTWLIGGLIAAGAVLVIAGIAAAVRRTG